MELSQVAFLLLILDGGGAFITALWTCLDASIIIWKQEEDRLNPLARRLYVYLSVMRGTVCMVSGCLMTPWPAISIYILDGTCYIMGAIEGSMDRWRAVVLWLGNWTMAGLLIAAGF